jgi:hypothetical protein
MKIRQFLSLTITAALLTVPCSIARSQDASSLQVTEPASDVVIQGRVVEETAKPLPIDAKYLILASRWTYRIRVTRLISGNEQARDIIATRDADAALLRDRDFVFHLTRRSDGIYNLTKVDRIG